MSATLLLILIQKKKVCVCVCVSVFKEYKSGGCKTCLFQHLPVKSKDSMGVYI